MEAMKQDLLELVSAIGPSGDEGQVAELIKGKLSSHVSDVRKDRMGNLLATKNAGEKAPTVALLAHMDEVSMVVTRIEGEFIYYHPVGTINKSITYGAPVLVLTESGPVPGVVCSPSVHLLQEIGEGWIDVGRRVDRVEVGDHIVFDTVPRWLDEEQDILAAKALDDRLGCAILIEIARRMKNVSLKANLVLAFTVQEEVGARGAQYVARTLDPDLVIAVDGALANDPVERSTVDFKLGTGPVIVRFEGDAPDKGRFVNFSDPDLVRALRRAGDDVGVPHHVWAVFNAYTDAAGSSKALLHMKSAAIGAPGRYFHSPYEVTSLKGIEHTVALLERYLHNEWS